MLIATVCFVLIDIRPTLSANRRMDGRPAATYSLEINRQPTARPTDSLEINRQPTARPTDTLGINRQPTARPTDTLGINRRLAPTYSLGINRRPHGRNAAPHGMPSTFMSLPFTAPSGTNSYIFYEKFGEGSWSGKYICSP